VRVFRALDTAKPQTSSSHSVQIVPEPCWGGGLNPNDNLASTCRVRAAYERTDSIAPRERTVCLSVLRHTLENIQRR